MNGFIYPNFSIIQSPISLDNRGTTVHGHTYPVKHWITCTCTTVNPQASNQQEAVLYLTCVGEDTQVLTYTCEHWYLPSKGCIHSLDWTTGLSLSSFLPITAKLNGCN